MLDLLTLSIALVARPICVANGALASSAPTLSASKVKMCSHGGALSGGDAALAIVAFVSWLCSASLSSSHRESS